MPILVFIGVGIFQSMHKQREQARKRTGNQAKVESKGIFSETSRSGAQCHLCSAECPIKMLLTRACKLLSNVSSHGSLWSTKSIVAPWLDGRLCVLFHARLVVDPFINECCQACLD